MDFQFNNKQELINCINKLNQDYYKPVDDIFKLFEEYARDNAAILLEYFRDAHDCFVRAISIKDIVNRKDKIDKYLEKYVKILQIIHIHEYVGLITVRKDDLLNVKLLPFEKREIKKQLSTKWTKLKRHTIRPFNYNNTNDELTTAINFYKETYEFIESIYKKYNL